MRVEQSQAALLVGTPLGQQLAHLANLGAQLEQVERHQARRSVRQPRSEPTSARWRTSLSSMSFSPSAGVHSRREIWQLSTRSLSHRSSTVPTHGVDQDGLADRAMGDDHDRLVGVARHAFGEEGQRARLRFEQRLAVRASASRLGRVDQASTQAWIARLDLGAILAGPAADVDLAQARLGAGPSRPCGAATSTAVCIARPRSLL